MRGLSVALLDAATSARPPPRAPQASVHGGLRYLEMFDFALVRESLTERERLRRLAPHLVRPLPFLVPIYRDSTRGLVKVRIGLRLYDWLTPGRDRERYRVLPPIDALSLEPRLRPDDLRGAATTSTTCCSRPSGSVWRTCSPPAVTARAFSTIARWKRSHATPPAPSPA